MKSKSNNPLIQIALIQIAWLIYGLLKPSSATEFCGSHCVREWGSVRVWADGDQTKLPQYDLVVRLVFRLDS